MGLCKCPKRQVTNQFCFEHRVNVCEHCMVTSHPSCVVQSYLQWLKDSDYDASCALCRQALEQGDCVRLICYHVFHWDCLNARAAAQPAHTAPGGHTCPVCAEHVFPPANLISPIADVLRQRLGAVNWGRTELGLPLIAGSEEQQMHVQQQQQQKQQQQLQQNVAHIHSSPAGLPNVRTNGASMPSTSSAFVPMTSKHALNGIGDGQAALASSSTGGPHSVLNMDGYDGPTSSRRPLLPRERPLGASDSDDNKYAKRSPAEMFRRWSRRFYAPSSRPPWRRTWCLVLSGLLAFFFFVFLMAVLGRGSYNADSSEFGAAQSHM